MRTFQLLSLLSLAFLLLFAEVPLANADGFVLNKGGRFVREEEQHAFIEWYDGNETLFVMTRTAASNESTLWILPVPAPPDQVTAEPVAKFPLVRREQNVVTGAKLVLNRSATIGLLMDTGIVPFCCGTVGGCGGNDKQTDVQVHQHTERLGMVVEVVTTTTTAGLDGYLASKQIAAQAASLSALAPYLKGEYSLICAWAAEPSVSPVARALRIDFPSPTVFYPLLPTSVYETPIEASLYVRGWFRHGNPASNPDTKCRYVQGMVEEIDYEVPKKYREYHRKHDPPEPLTRVTLASQPREWTQDLNLVPGAAAAAEFSQAIISLDLNLPFLLCSAVGVVLSPLLALSAIPRSRRCGVDFLWAGVVGAVMGLTVYASAIAFCIWFRVRCKRPELDNKSTLPSGSMAYVWCFFGTFGAYILYLFLSFLWAWSLSGRPWDIRDLAANALILFLAALLSAIFVHRVYKAAGLRSLWLVAFVALHLGIMQLTCRGLESWLTAWE